MPGAYHPGDLTPSICINACSRWDYSRALLINGTLCYCAISDLPGPALPGIVLPDRCRVHNSSLCFSCGYLLYAIGNIRLESLKLIV